MPEVDDQLGTVTLLMTDIEGSVRLWERDAQAMSEALRRHEGIAREVVARFGGVLVKARGEGDSLFCAFRRPADAVAAALTMQVVFQAETWPTEAPLRTRIALHTGEVEVRDGDYFGNTVNRCARLRAIAHGGQVLISHATEQLVRDALPEGADLIDHGMHRLRDLSRPERVFQLIHPSLEVGFPPLTSVDAMPNNLPVQLTSFIGREKEIADCVRLLRTRRLLTMVGAGGTGKTRLAIQVAAEAIELFPDGVWFVDLVGLSRGDLIARTIGDTLGLRESSEGHEPALSRFLSGKRALLILDNCEHLVREAAHVVRDLLTQTSELRILATSRQALSVQGEQLYPVPVMAHPKSEDKALVSKLLASDAGRLFYERARAIRPDFALTAQNAPTVAKLCAHLDGLPLAIELAAARIRSLSPEQILARLTGPFRILRDDSPTTDARHKTLRATIEWSVEMLTEPEKRFLTLLAVFRGGWTLDAAEAVCGEEGFTAEDVLSYTECLIDRSLIVADQRSSSTTRFTLLETIREYLLSLQEWAERKERIRRRHFWWFLSMVASAESHAAGSDQRNVFQSLESDLDNIRSAIEFGLSREDLAEETLSLVTLLHSFWVASAHFEEGRAWVSRALESARGADAGLRARAFNLNGVLAMLQGDLEAAVPLFERSLELRRELRDDAGAGATLVNLGMLAWEMNRLEEARDHFEKGVEVFRGLGRLDYLGIALLNLGCVLTELDQGELAAATLDQALELLEEGGDAAGMAMAAGNLAHQAILKGDVEQATRYAILGLEKCIEAHSVLSAHECLLVAAEILLHRKIPFEAARHYAAARQIVESRGGRVTPHRLARWSQIESALESSLGHGPLQQALAEGARAGWEETSRVALRDLCP